MKSLKMIFLLLFTVSVVYGQENSFLNYSSSSPSIKIPRLNLGAEVQWYPAGWIYGVRADLYLGKHTNWNFRVAYNNTDRKDFSKYNISEEGGGLGGALGYRHYFGKRKGFFLGPRFDFWDLTIDWKDVDANMNPTSGTTDIIVFQPTFEIGYQFIVDRHWVIAPTFANGWEFNVRTIGDDVEQNFITLLGVSVGYKLF